MLLTYFKKYSRHLVTLLNDVISLLMFCTVNMAAETKSVFAENFVKTKKDCKSFVWNYFGSLLNKANGLPKDLNNVYCSKCFENNEIKTYKDTVSTTNLAQHLRDCHSILAWWNCVLLSVTFAAYIGTQPRMHWLPARQAILC